MILEYYLLFLQTYFIFLLSLNMHKKWKIVFWIGTGILALLFLAVLFVSPILEHKIKKGIAEQLPSNLRLNDYSLSVSVMKGALDIQHLKLSLKQVASDSLPQQFVSVDKVSISEMSYFKLLFANEIKIGSIAVENPLIRLGKTTEFQTEFKSSPNEKEGPSLFIGQFLVKGMDVILYEKDTLPYLRLTESNFNFQGIEINKQSMRGKIPFRYKNYEIETGNFSVWLNSFDLLTVSNLEVEDGQLSARDFSIKTQYSKEILSTKIKKERDYVDLFIPEIRAHDFNLKQQSDSLSLYINQLYFKEPKAEIYRDKRIADDFSEKPLYSKSLRSLPFLLSVDTVYLEKATVAYEEKIHNDRSAGKIWFSDLEAKINYLSNFYDDENHMTKARIKAIFMDDTPIDVTWEFDILNPEDAFVFKAKLGKLEASALNSFTTPNLNVMLEGVLDETYFTIYGNNLNSTIDMRLKYQDFKVTLLNKKRKKKKLLSAVANLFVRKESLANNDHFKEGSATAERNIDRSVFNYLWINVEAGLKSTMLK